MKLGAWTLICRLMELEHPIATSLDTSKMELVSQMEAEMDEASVKLPLIQSNWHEWVDGRKENVGRLEHVIASSWKEIDDDTVRLTLTGEYTGEHVATVELSDFCPHCGHWNMVDGKNLRILGVVCRKCLGV